MIMGRKRVLVEGIVVGLAGAAAVAIWFLLYDLAEGVPFRTPALLAAALFHGLRDAGALTVTPVLSYYLLPQSKATHRHQDSLLLQRLKWAAGYLIRFSMRRAALLLGITWVLVGLGLYLAMFVIPWVLVSGREATWTRVAICVIFAFLLVAATLLDLKAGGDAVLDCDIAPDLAVLDDGFPGRALDLHVAADFAAC